MVKSVNKTVNMVNVCFIGNVRAQSPDYTVISGMTVAVINVTITSNIAECDAWCMELQVVMKMKL